LCWVDARDGGKNFYLELKEFRISQFETVSMKLSARINDVIGIHKISTEFVDCVVSYTPEKRERMIELFYKINPIIKLCKDFHVKTIFFIQIYQFFLINLRSSLFLIALVRWVVV
jgi:hypothetical protein